MSDICVHGRWIPRGCDDCCAEVVELRKRIRLARKALGFTLTGVTVLSTEWQRQCYAALDLRKPLAKARGRRG